jgi:hypothetical protein
VRRIRPGVVRDDVRILGRGGWRHRLADLPRDNEPGERVDDNAWADVIVPTLAGIAVVRTS